MFRVDFVPPTWNSNEILIPKTARVPMKVAQIEHVQDPAKFRKEQSYSNIPKQDLIKFRDILTEAALTLNDDSYERRRRREDYPKSYTPDEEATLVVSDYESIDGDTYEKRRRNQDYHDEYPSYTPKI